MSALIINPVLGLVFFLDVILTKEYSITSADFISNKIIGGWVIRVLPEVSGNMNHEFLKSVFRVTEGLGVISSSILKLKLNVFKTKTSFEVENENTEYFLSRTELHISLNSSFWLVSHFNYPWWPMRERVLSSRAKIPPPYGYKSLSIILVIPRLASDLLWPSYTHKCLIFFQCPDLINLAIFLDNSLT